MAAELPAGGDTDSESRARWYLPFLWIIFVPVATIPLTVILTDRIGYGVPGACRLTPSFFGAYADCPQTTILLMLIPGVLNLVPVWWVLSHQSKARVAAIWASCLGAVRLVVPAVAVMASANGASISGTAGWTGFPNAGYGPSFTAIGVVLWVATFPVLWMVARARD